MDTVRGVPRVHGRRRVRSSSTTGAFIGSPRSPARREWDAEITEQTPDQRIAWKATDGTSNAGAVTFHRLDDNLTRIALQLDVDPQGIVETMGDTLGFVRRRAEADLQRFTEMIENRGVESGAWRGTVHQQG